MYFYLYVFYICNNYMNNIGIFKEYIIYINSGMLFV